MLSLLSWFFGYVTVLVTGDKIERFMNLCALKRRDMWDFQIVEQGLQIKVRVSEYKNLRYAARQSGSHLHICEKHGLPFLLYRHRNRYGLAVGALVFVIALTMLCGRIWSIETSGIATLEETAVIEILEEFGIHEGVRKNKYEWATLRQQILSAHSEIAWMSMNPQGTVLHVDISETQKPPKIPDASEPCDLVASCDGVIVSLEVNSGQTMVKVGDGVVKGDVLVSGAVEYADGCTVFRHASGKVIAQTKRKVDFEIPLQKTVATRTGESFQRRVVTIFGISIPLYLGSVQGAYEKEVSHKQLVVAGKKLPISMKTAVFYPTVSTSITLTEEEGVKEGTKKTEEYIKKSLSHAEILDVIYDHTIKDGCLRLKAEIFCKENIVFEEKMLIF